VDERWLAPYTSWGEGGLKLPTEIDFVRADIYLTNEEEHTANEYLNLI